MCGSFNYEEMQQLEKDMVRLREREQEQGREREREGSMKEGTLSTGNILPIMLTSLPHKPDDILVDG